MAKDFWFKFNFKDWKYDTQLLSTEEKGLLIELIIFMRENNGECEINFRLINRLTEIATENFQVACRTFREKGIFDFEMIDGKEFFISRKIKKELEKSQINKENGKKGGNPILLNNQKRLSETVIRKDNRTPNSNSNSNLVLEKKEKVKNKFLDEVRLTDEELLKLRKIYTTPEDLDWAFNKLNNYKKAKGKKYKSDYHVLIGWVLEEWQQTKKSNVKPNSLKAISENGSKAKEILKQMRSGQ